MLVKKTNSSDYTSLENLTLLNARSTEIILAK